jgi:hypothetical protein
MLVYKVGDVFPHPDLKRVGFDAPRAQLIPNGFFNIVLHSTQPQLDKGLATASMHIDLYQKDAIPFVLLNWPGKMAFEVILNVHTLTDDYALEFVENKNTGTPLSFNLCPTHHAPLTLIGV